MCARRVDPRFEQVEILRVGRFRGGRSRSFGHSWLGSQARFISTTDAGWLSSGRDKWLFVREDRAGIV